MNIFARRFIEFRRLLGFTQTELATILKITRQTLSEWERSIKIPSRNTLYKINTYASENNIPFPIDDIILLKLLEKIKKLHLKITLNDNFQLTNGRKRT
jgi:transcriptional regulator with XRE-family HTH domain